MTSRGLPRGLPPLQVIVECPGFVISRLNLARLYLVSQRHDRYGVLAADAALQVPRRAPVAAPGPFLPPPSARMRPSHQP